MLAVVELDLFFYNGSINNKGFLINCFLNILSKLLILIIKKVTNSDSKNKNSFANI